MIKILAIGDFHGKFPEKLKKEIEKEKPDLILGTGDYTGIDEWRPWLKKAFKARERGKDIWVENLIGKARFKRLLKKDYAAGKVILKEINKLKVKTLSVFGNGDWYSWQYNRSNRDYKLLIRKLKYIKDINRGKGNFKGLKFVGFGGYLDPDIYFTKKGRKAIFAKPGSEKRMRKRYKDWEKELMKLMKNKPDIMLIHYTPYRCLDKMKEKGFMLTGSPMGVSSYNRAIRKYKPALVVCGHMHENPGTCKIGKTIVINPGPAHDGKMAFIEFDEKKKKVGNVRFVK